MNTLNETEAKELIVKISTVMSKDYNLSKKSIGAFWQTFRNGAQAQPVIEQPSEPEMSLYG